MRCLLFHGLDLLGIGLDLLEVRRPLDLDRSGRRVAGSGSGLRSDWLLRLEFPHRLPLVRWGCHGRFVNR